ncbi:MAG: ABC transporter ATP-binding protein [Erysipelotrichia bacterium]|jgi:ABC-2 type transport system ATP-binding protein|nr:ABC transporter ATP-binding protein [Erysipelotrichia bacterium]
MDVIVIQDLSKYYGKSRGIENVSFSVKEGEIFGFIGPNGAGKSTTIRTLLGLLHPTRGSATIFGKDITQYGPEIRENIGYLPSEVFYYEKMKVKELLAYSASFYPGDHTKRIQELATLLELDMNRKIEDLSFGNKKKVRIIQGLLHKPSLIILDEPTSGLDPLMQHKFFNLLKEENKRGATILFSSHILQEVQNLCHRVAIIKDGVIIKVEEVASLRTKATKKVKVFGCHDLSSFKDLECKDLQHIDSTVSFVYQGEIEPLLKVLSNTKLSDVLIEEPTLEEIFMHYYVRESDV